MMGRGAPEGKAGMMTFRDYMAQVEADGREAVGKGAEWYASWDDMYEALFIDDAVTGNGSGSYTFDSAEAAENARGLLFDEEFASEAEAAGLDVGLFAEGPEAVDVVARCLALALVSGALKAAYEEARGAAS